MKKRLFEGLLCLLTIILLSACVEKDKFPSPLQGVEIATVYLNADQTSHTISVVADLSRFVLWEATDSATNEKPTWVKDIKLSKDKVEISLEENITIKDRCAHISLYTDQSRTDYENSDLRVNFSIIQFKNKMFEGLDISEVVMPYTASDTLIGFNRELQGIKLETKSLNGSDVSWCKPTLLSSMVLKVHADTYKSAGVRQALIRLLPSNKGNVSAIDSMIAHKAILVTQKQNPVFEAFQQDSVINILWNQANDTLKFSNELTDIRCLMTDSATQKSPSWLQATISGKQVIFIAQNNKTRFARTANVTLYLPNNGTTIDSTTVHTTFTVRQLRNNVFEEGDYGNLTFSWDQTADTIKTTIDASAVKCVMKDSVTGIAGEKLSWLTIDKKEKMLILKPTKLTSKTDRQAKVTLFMSNSSTPDSTAAQVTFTVAQQHNDIFDTLKISNRGILYNQKSDTLRLKRELKDIRCQVIDKKTQQVASWIPKVEVSGKEVIFSAKENTAFDSRTAIVTLYLLDGKDVESSTVKTSFELIQGFKAQVQIEEKKVEVDHTEQVVELHVKSNSRYQIESPGTWVQAQLNQIDEYNDIIKLVFPENKTNEKHVGDLKLLVNGQEMAKITLTQLTNPKIEINFDDNRKEMSFAKAGGKFNLPIKTLTPDYKIAKKGSWVSISKATTKGIDQYYHEVTIPYFSGDAFERRDTIVISNFKETVTFPIIQHKYIYLNTAKQEVEAGSSYQLVAKTNTGRSITWTSSKEDIATVDNKGLVKAIKKGTTQIKASIGTYSGVTDYYDYCDITVFTPSDKVDINRGNGNYEKIEGVVTSDCPVVITNNYSKTIKLNSLQIEGTKNGSPVTIDINVKDSNNDDENIKIKKGEAQTFQLPGKLVKVYNPVVKLQFSVSGSTDIYIKTFNY